MADKEKSVFELLNSIDVSDKVEKKKSGKNELSYLSWTWAWTEFKKKFPKYKCISLRGGRAYFRPNYQLLED